MRTKEQILSSLYATLCELESMSTTDTALGASLISELSTLVWVCDDEIDDEYIDRISKYVAI